jgi:hypothetical protein
MMDGAPDPRHVALGLAVRSARAGMSAGRVALWPARMATHAPVIGVPLQRAARDLAHEGSLAVARSRVTAETAVGAVLAAPEVERVAIRVLATADVDRVIAAVLDHEMTERALDRALASSGLERLIVRVLESRLVDDLTEQVLRSPEMERVVQHIATSPQVVEAVTQHTQTLAEEMVEDVRRRTHSVDEIAERTVRGWLRRPRPSPS